jgi:hypothetical protein
VAGVESASPQRSVRHAIYRVANDKHHTEVDDLFAQWKDDPLAMLSFPDLEM